MSHVVALPRTDTRRGAFASLTLVERVNLDPQVPAGVAFEGRMFKCGSQVQIEDLKGCQPDAPVLVLEVTEVEDSTYVGPRKRRWLLLYVLWRWDTSREVWIEHARLVSPDQYTSMEFRRIAYRILEPETLTAVESIEQSAVRLHSYIQAQVDQLQVEKIAVYERVLYFLVAKIVQDRGSMEWPGRTVREINRARN